MCTDHYIPRIQYGTDHSKSHVSLRKPQNRTSVVLTVIVQCVTKSWNEIAVRGQSLRDVRGRKHVAFRSCHCHCNGDGNSVLDLDVTREPKFCARTDDLPVEH